MLASPTHLSLSQLLAPVLPSQILDSLKHPAFSLAATLHWFQFRPLLLCSRHETCAHVRLPERGGVAGPGVASASLQHCICSTLPLPLV